LRQIDEVDLSTECIFNGACLGGAGCLLMIVAPVMDLFGGERTFLADLGINKGDECCDCL
jgi:hypothetical protein